MNIISATKVALKKSCAMTRPDLIKAHSAVIPKQHGKTCEYTKVDTKTKTPIRRWAPRIEDILAKDWFVIER